MSADEFDQEAGSDHSEDRSTAVRHEEASGQPNDRMRVLRMVADGKITAAEAEDLLRALEPAGVGRDEAGRQDGVEDVAYATAGPPFGPGFPFGPQQPFGPGFGFATHGPVPPVPPMPPMPPFPPGDDAQRAAWQRAADKWWKAQKRFPQWPMPPGEPRRGTPFYSLAIEIRDGETVLNAHLPIALAKSGDKFLPRQVRNYLSQYEIDLGALLEDLANAGDPTAALESLGRVGGDGTLVEMHDGETILVIKVERSDGP